MKFGSSLVSMALYAMDRWRSAQRVPKAKTVTLRALLHRSSANVLTPAEDQAFSESSAGRPPGRTARNVGRPSGLPEGTPEGFNPERGASRHSRAGERSAQDKGYKCLVSGKAEASVMGRGLQGEYLCRLSIGGLFPSRMPAPHPPPS